MNHLTLTLNAVTTVVCVSLPAPLSTINSKLLECLKSVFENSHPPVFPGTTWTTDAPFRETEAASHYSRSQGILGVEMEASALYAFEEAKGHPVICFAHITNQMGNVENDFEKGEAQGSLDAIEVIFRAAEAWLFSTSKTRNGALID